jgi:4-diphosphocytidyl-2-C-methyl-D-erythritol kinase
MASASVIAQAKINLLLRVLAREESGYHSIETILLRLELGDDVRVRVASGRSLECTGPALPTGGLGPTERNLAYRAATAYADATGWPSGFDVEIGKNIPVGGGLGGGSADAGAVLRALDALSPHPLGSRLVDLAAPLGADVPFMTIDSPMALAWGRGERMMPLDALDARHVALVIPSFGVSTADAYGWVAADRGRYIPQACVISREALTTWEAITAVATNDFEAVVARRHPIISNLVAELASRDALLTMMSGSGSTVFGVFNDPPDAAVIAPLLPGNVTLTRTAMAVAAVRID